MFLIHFNFLGGEHLRCVFHFLSANNTDDRRIYMIPVVFHIKKFEKHLRFDYLTKSYDDHYIVN